ncbi:MAG TPA: DnaB family ATPase [Anaerolineales bacterium]|nr:DnaB family ATPase [Anaerolineales bacterium]
MEEAISKIQPREVGLGLGPNKELVKALKETVQDLLSTPHNQGIDKATLLQRIRIDSEDNEKIYQAMEKGITEDQNEEELYKSILSARRSIERHIKELKVSDVLTSAAASWNYHRDKIKDTRDFLSTVWSQLEPLSSLRTKEDGAMINEVRIGDAEQVKKIVSDIRVSIVENRVYKTGWQGLNRMLQGGIRPGEFWIQAALPHKYKTGLSQSIFNQVALYNKPLTNIPGRKPTLVLFSFEDTMTERFQFIFMQMMFTETREHVDVSSYSVEQMQNFVLSKLSVNGFELFLYRVDPNKWSYIDLFNRVIDLEHSGYSIEFVLIDYLEKLPTTGCNHTGPAGTDILDLISRVRTFFNSKGIACWTPHQLSTESKQLIRGSVTEDKFVQALVGRGYYKGTRQLDQIPDGIILHHLLNYNGEWYLAIQRDRHRITSIVDEKYKLFYLKFLPKMPLPDDLYGADSTIYRLPPYSSNVNESLFNFD